MGETEHESQRDDDEGAGTDPLLEQQTGHGHGLDEGERDQALDADE
jgi:hypothetical protein